MTTKLQAESAEVKAAAPRPGGRAARIQAAIFSAVESLQQEVAPAELTVPAIAAAAGVTPSTIYRRWGTLAQLLSDVAVKRLRPDSEPADTGTLGDDLARWLDEYVDELASGPGRALLCEILGAGSSENAQLCSSRTQQQLDAIRLRAIQRGETPPETDVLFDRVIAPVVYRILFAKQLPDVSYAQALLKGVLGSV
ncbi:transcriptional regulator, TetR family [Paraburkholderia atlantica]|uniref:Transcriptional regulator, TetR family n=1 Tax=Paraburkholderia atlantica TaxID=2654982 RepID=D5WFF3_PARAM|nr:TetR/AcrR family transcriptional regulator [Paraburkholderia atlantica]ADG19307.1 transcriptional regulator, TetR family [Paraburkholderia atlantica]